MTNIFVANINVDAQNNFNYMRDDFVNKERVGLVINILGQDHVIIA